VGAAPMPNGVCAPAPLVRLVAAAAGVVGVDGPPLAACAAPRTSGSAALTVWVGMVVPPGATSLVTGRSSRVGYLGAANATCSGKGVAEGRGKVDRAHGQTTRPVGVNRTSRYGRGGRSALVPRVTAQAASVPTRVVPPAQGSGPPPGSSGRLRGRARLRRSGPRLTWS